MRIEFGTDGNIELIHVNDDMFPIIVVARPGPDNDPKAWVARLGPPITEADTRYGISRTFLRREYHRSRPGAYLFRIFEVGIYELQTYFASGDPLANTAFRMIFEIDAPNSVGVLARSDTSDLRNTYRRLEWPAPLENWMADPLPVETATPVSSPRRRLTRIDENQ